MKKSLCFITIILSFAGSAFADALATHTPTSGGGMAIRGGASQQLATDAPTPLIKCSTGVYGMVNWAAGAAGNDSAGYLIATRHMTGSKNFATTNSRTNIYWKQASKVTATNDIVTAMQAEIAADTEDAFVFDNVGWTSY
ncbi:MAG: hypothetical protein ACYDG4_06680 [Desulfuromonadaceae bacterium]